MDSFYKTLTNEPLKAFYGEKHVFRAAEAQAIEVLLISDKLFRARVSEGFFCLINWYVHATIFVFYLRRSIKSW